MRDDPDISKLAHLIGDAARSHMLLALLNGKALTARELAEEAGITPQTASSHLAQLTQSQLLTIRKQGRHRYFQLADSEVARLLETLIGVAEKKGFSRTRTGPRNSQLRHARICYDHLAGEMGVMLYDKLLHKKALYMNGQSVQIGDETSIFQNFGVDLSALSQHKRTLCRPCLDWSMRRNHLAGTLGAAILSHILEKGWAKRIEGTRIIQFTPNGKRQFHAALGE